MTKRWEGAGEACETPSPSSLSSALLQMGSTGAHWAACCGHLEALRTLLAAGANTAAANKVRQRRGKMVKGHLGPYR